MSTLRLALVVPLICVAAFAQSRTTDEPPPAFDVASIKVSEPPTQPPPHDSCSGARSPHSPGLFTARRKSLKQIIQCAFSLEDYQVSGGPAWLASERFDIDAKPAEAATDQQMLVMLQTLLGARFGLTFHKDIRPTSMTVLSLAEGGPKFGQRFHPFKQDEDPPKPVPGERPFAPSTIKNWASTLRVQIESSDPLQQWLEIPPIVDQTGLTDVYKITLQFDKLRLDFSEWVRILDHQLGLKLEQRKLPIEVMVIDAAVKPPAN